ncbi:unnamed protein product [Brachionus calyciflorus]|uniref:Uncharacterized protein n=1 Tax=Brachionus calyciflorus TaxID=104777 RepID=A0A814J7S4_9BILA|nr:unnamed protein product [Brachionus calyciflorus]
MTHQNSTPHVQYSSTPSRINLPKVTNLFTSKSSITIVHKSPLPISSFPSSQSPYSPNLTLDKQKKRINPENLESVNIKRIKIDHVNELTSSLNTNKIKKNSHCKHCFRSDHLRITSINCLRNKNNPNFIPFDILIEQPVPPQDQSELLEYTINTQDPIVNNVNNNVASKNNSNITHKSSCLLEIPEPKNNNPRIRTPEQIINNRNIAKKNYQKKTRFERNSKA